MQVKLVLGLGMWYVCHYVSKHIIFAEKQPPPLHIVPATKWPWNWRWKSQTLLDFGYESSTSSWSWSTPLGFLYKKQAKLSILPALEWIIFYSDENNIDNNCYCAYQLV